MASQAEWRSKLSQALVLIIAVAVVARVVYGLLEPLLPGLVALLVVGGLLVWVIGRRH